MSDKTDHPLSKYLSIDNLADAKLTFEGDEIKYEPLVSLWMSKQIIEKYIVPHAEWSGLKPEEFHARAIAKFEHDQNRQKADEARQEQRSRAKRPRERHSKYEAAVLQLYSENPNRSAGEIHVQLENSNPDLSPSLPTVKRILARIKRLT